MNPDANCNRCDIPEEEEEEDGNEGGGGDDEEGVNEEDVDDFELDNDDFELAAAGEGQGDKVYYSKAMIDCYVFVVSGPKSGKKGKILGMGGAAIVRILVDDGSEEEIKCFPKEIVVLLNDAGKKLQKFILDNRNKTRRNTRRTNPFKYVVDESEVKCEEHVPKKDKRATLPADLLVRPAGKLDTSGNWKKVYLGYFSAETCNEIKARFDTWCASYLEEMKKDKVKYPKLSMAEAKRKLEEDGVSIVIVNIFLFL